MINVVGIRFKPAGKIYFFDPDNLDIKKGDFAIVETIRGVEFGEVVVGPKDILEEDIVSPLKKVIRVATPADIVKNKENKEKEKSAFDICIDKIEAHGLDMKLVEVEYTFDNNKIIFYFTADGRIDFRELVKDLASVFRTRIELRQIGVRDEAKMLGGIGPCGRPLCCSRHLGDFNPVSIKMAKEQKLSLNPTKISGLCSRLMCCLNFEHKMYEKNLAKLPNVGDKIKDKETKRIGYVLDVNPLLENAKVKLKKEDGNEEIVTIDGANITVIEAAVIENNDEVDTELLKELEEN